MNTSFNLPKIIFGTSSLGNLYVELENQTKLDIVREMVDHSRGTPVFDSAGKYGAGLALESLGQCLANLDVAPDEALISNKLGWKRAPLQTAEPTFEPGVWKNLKYDAVQAISYDGILECYEEGNGLLGDYNAQLVSIHDPDEYLQSATSPEDEKERKTNILEAYRALQELKNSGAVNAIGVGAKDPSIIDFVSQHVHLDWAMFACSITPYTHKSATLTLARRLGGQGTTIINSAVFNGGFLIGQEKFDYQSVCRASHPHLFQWREKFNGLCQKFNVKPAEACVQFSFLFDAIKSVALNTSSPKRVRSNIQLAETTIPDDFWQALSDAKLIHIPF